MTSDPRERARRIFRGALVLAPMTKGSNVPYRRLCREFGAGVTVGEMAIAKKVVRRRRGELALVRAHPEDHPFGVQLADRDERTLADAAAIAEQMGADFVDLNCGCPIDLFCRRGLGARLLERPAKIGRLVAAMRRAVSIPVTVKLRLGWSERRLTYLDAARAAEQEGADALCLHPRTRAQRYTKAADWEHVARLKEAVSVPVIGNGDVLTWWEAEEALRRSGADALMIARGALVKPWIFREIRERRTWIPSARERLDVVRRYVALAREHFGEDEHGRRRILAFLVWHLGFLARWRPLPEERFRDHPHPLLQTRLAPPPTEDPLERLLFRDDEPARLHLARIALGELPEDAPPPPPPAEGADDLHDRLLTSAEG